MRATIDYGGIHRLGDALDLVLDCLHQELRGEFGDNNASSAKSLVLAWLTGKSFIMDSGESRKSGEA